MNDHSLSRLDKLHRAPGAFHYRPVDCRARMRNTAILVKWIEEHQSNPYPTKAEKQYLGYYSGMNLTQLSTWFANARRRIKKIGMKVWLEGRSTFTVDLFSNTTSSRPVAPMTGGDAGYASGAGSYANSYLYQQPLNSTYTANQTSTASLSNLSSLRGQSLLNNGTMQPVGNSVYSPDSSMGYCGTVSSSGLYGSPQQRASTFTQPLIGVPNLSFPAMPSSQVLPSSAALSSVPVPRPSSHNVPPLHSPLTAQVYSSDPLRTQTSIDVSDGSYGCLQQQHSPDSQILPECASSEPTMLQESPKQSHYHHTE